MKKMKTYKPGEVIPMSGIYRVEHQSHRLMHEATLLRDGLFPRCRKCTDAVRYRLLRSVGDRHIPFRPSVILEEFEARSCAPEIDGREAPSKGRPERCAIAK
jgi:hypothetical protein